MPKREIQRILVIKLSALGDFVLALAAMKKIRQAHPKAHITLLTTPPFEALSRACPYVDSVDIDGEPEDFSDWTRLVGGLRAARFDRVYDLECSVWTNRLFQLLLLQKCYPLLQTLGLRLVFGIWLWLRRSGFS